MNATMPTRMPSSPYTSARAATMAGPVVRSRTIAMVSTIVSAAWTGQSAGSMPPGGGRGISVGAAMAGSLVGGRRPRPGLRPPDGAPRAVEAAAATGIGGGAGDDHGGGGRRRVRRGPRRPRRCRRRRPCPSRRTPSSAGSDLRRGEPGRRRSAPLRRRSGGGGGRGGGGDPRRARSASRRRRARERRRVVDVAEVGRGHAAAWRVGPSAVVVAGDRGTRRSPRRRRRGRIVAYAASLRSASVVAASAAARRPRAARAGDERHGGGHRGRRPAQRASPGDRGARQSDATGCAGRRGRLPSVRGGEGGGHGRRPAAGSTGASRRLGHGREPARRARSARVGGHPGGHVRGGRAVEDGRQVVVGAGGLMVMGRGWDVRRRAGSGSRRGSVGRAARRPRAMRERTVPGACRAPRRSRRSRGRRGRAAPRRLGSRRASSGQRVVDVEPVGHGVVRLGRPWRRLEADGPSSSGRPTAASPAAPELVEAGVGGHR